MATEIKMDWKQIETKLKWDRNEIGLSSDYKVIADRSKLIAIKSKRITVNCKHNVIGD